MKYLAFLTIFLVMSFNIVSQEKLKFNNYLFGTTFDIINEKESYLISFSERGINTSQNEGAYKGSNNNVANYLCGTFYIFENKLLIAGYYSVYIENNEFVYLNAYEDLKTRLNKVYGNPVSVDISVPMDSIRNKLVTKWNVGDGVVELEIYNTGSYGEWKNHLIIFYKSKKYIENEINNERNRRNNLDGL